MNPSSWLDLAVVLGVLEAISGVTDLETLIATVLRLGLEHAGAERGLLILPYGDAYQIEATAKTGDDGVIVALRRASVTAAELPESVFQYVLRTRETVLLHDAPAGGAFSDDDYVRRHSARSVRLTERKRAEQALREREYESRLILDTIPGPVAVLTAIGDLEAINHELAMFCGESAEEMKHWATNGTVHPDDMPRIGPIFANAIATGTPVDNEARIRRFDGVYRRVQVRGLPLRDSDGRILRWYVLLADIEDRKRAEDALDETREELARVARVMTLSALTASIAHEVNQPLSGIITNSGTCLRMLDANPPNVEGARETARRAIRDGHRASDVINRLRAMFSKKEFTLEPMDLNEATREVVALSLNDLQRNRVAVQLALADPLPIVMGDRVQIQQVILNLLRNASEAMSDVEDRPRQVEVRTELSNDEGVRLTVRDAGVGVDRENLHKLFDTFYTTKHGGMGIGLSISRSIIERHHGRMWAEPNDGPGATFAFSIPRTNAE